MIVAGVDLGVRKAAIAILDGPNMLYVGAFESKAVSRSTQLHEVAAWVLKHCIEHKVEAVYVEEPLVGRSTRVSLQIAQTAGGVLCTLDHLGHLSGPYLVSNTSWKKEVTGKGAGKDIKKHIREWLDEMFPGYAAQCDGDQDQYDATCIAIYGERQQRLAAELRKGALLSGAPAFSDGQALA